MFRVIMGDKSNTIWLTNWLEKRRIGSPDEVNAIIKAGVTDGAGIVHWPQAWVDNIPIKRTTRSGVSGSVVHARACQRRPETSGGYDFWPASERFLNCAFT